MEVKDIPIEKTYTEENIRQIDNKEGLSYLMQTIKDNGLLQPVGVKETSNGYKMLWGNRRLAACTKLGWKTIPAVIFSEKKEVMSEQDFVVINAIENLQQSPNTLLELGRIVKILRKTMSIGEIAVRLGIPKTRVKCAMDELARVPKKWQSRIRLISGSNEKKGDIALSSAAKITRLREINDKERDKLFKHVSKNETNTAEVSLVASLLKQGMTLKKAIEKAEKYTSLNFSVYVQQERYDQIMANREGSAKDLIVECINTVYPKLAIKNLRK